MAKENYWTNRYNNLPNYIVVGRDYDGITGFTVVHKDNEREFKSGCYSGEIMNGFSMNRKELQEKADKMNEEEA